MKRTIEDILKKAVGNEAVFDVLIPEESSFGHYSTNVAMRLGKAEKKDPMVLGEEIAEKIRASSPKGFFEKVDVTKPGFINFWLTPQTLQKEFLGIAKKKDSYGKSALGKGKTAIIEHSQPNIAKELHVGHLRTTFIGDALSNIHEFSGYKVVRWNYLGDWGTQFGKVIAAYKLWGKKSDVQKNAVKELSNLYIRFHDEAKRDPALEDRAREEFRKLEGGDSENKKLWEWFKKESVKKLEEIYKVLGVKFTTWIGESSFEKDMKSVIRRLTERGFAKKSEGALIVPLEEFGLPPALVEKSDGTSLYLSRDIANLEYRIKKFKPVKLLYVVGNEQTLHFEQLFAIAKKMGISGPEMTHVKYGLILGDDARKLATREGRTILAEDMVEKAVALARTVIKEKARDLSRKEKETVAHAVGIGALKYNTLRENHRSDMVFDWKKMLDFSGESGPYLQYTYARLRSIVRKAGKAGKANLGLLTKKEELAVMRKVFDFPEEIKRSTEAYSTNNITIYLYELANLANRFYETTPVLSSQGGSASGGKEENVSRRNARLLLIGVVASVLKRGLRLLGIEAPERI